MQLTQNYGMDLAAPVIRTILMVVEEHPNDKHTYGDQKVYFGGSAVADRVSRITDQSRAISLT